MRKICDILIVLIKLELIISLILNVIVVDVNTQQPPICGDGIITPPEICDTLINGCCGPDCTSILPFDTLCRASLGICDPGTRCDGISADCASQVYYGSDTLCRAAMGSCDVPEYCDGSGPPCPKDLAAPSTTLCYDADFSQYPCELDSYCPGTDPNIDPNAKICPSVQYRNDSFTCREQQTFCDEPENCNPLALDPGECPSDFFKNSTTPCPSDNLDCSSALCQGTSDNCIVQSMCAACLLDIQCPVVDATCATGVCNGGVCETSVIPDTCLIDGQCYLDGESSPYNQCQFCNSAVSQTAWTDRAIGFSCSTLTPEGPCSTQDTCGAGGVCMDRYLGNGTVCRLASGDCDLPDHCPGDSDLCSPDEFRDSSFECRAALPGDTCDWPEYCTGFGPDCPPDQVRPQGVLCRPLEGVCDVPEVCDGVNKTCPPNMFKEPDFQCRLLRGPCDEPKFCLGNNVSLAEQPWLCPPENFQPPGFICRPMTGPCDQSEVCSGVSADCPPDMLYPNGTLCRAPAGLCDKPEYCDGLVNTCPSDEAYGPETVCRPSNGTCNPEERCPGQGIKQCPADVISPNTTICRFPEGSCENFVFCPGPGQPESWLCPPRSYKAAGTLCRPQDGICDFPELCEGANPFCPRDQVAPITTICRPSLGVCDKIDFCDGVNKNCPPNEVQPPTVTCHFARGSCETSVNCDGVLVDCPPFNYLDSSTICRISEGDCDPPETCDPFSMKPWLCPPNMVFPNDTLCRTPGGPCGTPTYCDGIDVGCPPEEYMNGTVCRPATSQCDLTEICDGEMAQCPPDERVPLGWPCDLDMLNCTIDECDGLGNCLLIQDDCECMVASDCPVNATCIIPHCINGFCSEELAPGECLIDGTCYQSGDRNPSNQCESCQPSVDPTSWEPVPFGEICQSFSPDGPCKAQATCDGMGFCEDNFFDNSTVCREPKGLCDEAERCPGGTPFCPPDQVKGPGVLCRNATGGLCDEPEYCTANDPFCPPDQVSPANKTCLFARGPCEQNSNCRGLIPNVPLDELKICPTRLLFGNDTVCRESIASCDKTEYCDPNSQMPWECPPDEVQPSTFECRPAAGPCDLPENCDGIMHICPNTDQKRPPTYQCNPSENTCEQPSFCDGVSDPCPSNNPEPITTICYIAQGLCDNNVNCDGQNLTCPNMGQPVLKPNGTQCYTRRGDCEGDGFCDGENVQCNEEGFFSALFVCRPSTGPCDMQETCPGNYWECPPDMDFPDGYPCPNGIFCDGDETCLAGVCQPPPGRNCSDPNQCTIDSCNEDAMQCEHTPLNDIGQPCYNGPPDTVNVGQCREGSILCDPVTGDLSCIDEVLPLPFELCGDNIDNNCNGVVDEGCAGLTCVDDADCEPFKPSPCHTAHCSVVEHTNRTFCSYTLMPDFCFVYGNCYTPGEIDPFNQCKDCQPSVDPLWFTDNDSIPVDNQNVCDGVEQCFHGQVIANPKPPQCPNLYDFCKFSECDPILGCVVVNQPNGTNCTLDDHYTCTVQSQCLTGECVCNGTIIPPMKKNGVNWLTIVIVLSSVLLGLLILFLLFIFCCPSIGISQRTFEQSVRNRNNSRNSDDTYVGRNGIIQGSIEGRSKYIRIESKNPNINNPNKFKKF